MLMKSSHSAPAPPGNKPESGLSFESRIMVCFPQNKPQTVKPRCRCQNVVFWNASHLSNWALDLKQSYSQCSQNTAQVPWSCQYPSQGGMFLRWLVPPKTVPTKGPYSQHWRYQSSIKFQIPQRICISARPLYYSWSKPLQRGLQFIYPVDFKEMFVVGICNWSVILPNLGLLRLHRYISILIYRLKISFLVGILLWGYVQNAFLSCIQG